MGTVTQFPATMDLATAVATLGDMTVADLEAEIGRARTAAALEALTSIPDLVAITLRRELGGVGGEVAEALAWLNSPPPEPRAPLATLPLAEPAAARAAAAGKHPA